MALAQQMQQSDEEEKRKLWDEGLLKQRPKSQTAGVRRRKPAYKRVTPPIPYSASSKSNETTNTIADTIIGITIYKLRPSATDDDKGSRLLEQEKESNRLSEWTAERIEASSVISEGDRIRIAIETPRKGYLYVINREKYSDGTFGEPYLIFPTLRTRGGENSVMAGRVIEIPSQEDNPPYFRLRRSGPRQEAEILTILVMLQPITNIQIGRNPLRLSREQFTIWEKTWNAPIEQIEMVGEVDNAYTNSEKEAGLNGSRLLTQDDPLPQTVYRIHAKPNDPLFVNVTLRIGR